MPTKKTYEKTYEKTYDHPYESKVNEETRQHLRAARHEFRRSMKGMIPRGFVEHQRRARREMLLAWRSMIDARLSRLDEETAEDIMDNDQDVTASTNPDIVE